MSAASENRTKVLLNSEIEKIEAEISAVKAKIAISSEVVAPQAKPRLNVQLNEHAFDESEKYIKIFIPFNACKIEDENVTVEFTENSCNVFIQTEHKDHHFIVKSLLKPIDVSKSYRKVKPDMISVYLKKANEGEKILFKSQRNCMNFIRRR